MAKLRIDVLINYLENMRIRIYDLYVYTLDLGMADALLAETNNIDQLVLQLKNFDPGSSKKPV